MTTYISSYTSNDEKNVIVETHILRTITKIIFLICYLVATVKL